MPRLLKKILVEKFEIAVPIDDKILLSAEVGLVGKYYDMIPVVGAWMKALIAGGAFYVYDTMILPMTL